MQLEDRITTLKGIGPKKAEILSGMHIETLEDLILYFPRDYQDRRTVTPLGQVQQGQTVTIIARVASVTQHFYRAGRKQALRLSVSDDTGSGSILFFHASYLQKIFQVGAWYAFYGSITMGKFGPTMVHPDFADAKSWEPAILPVYPLKQGITQKEMRHWQRQVAPLYDAVEDYLTEDFRTRHRLCETAYALRGMHAPGGREHYQQARYRLVFDELFLLQTGIAVLRNRVETQEGIAFDPAVDPLGYIQQLPFPLTCAQARCVAQIMKDLESPKVMNRLVQGDVGSGKTVVAEIAMYKAVRSGYQAVMMAPTEILAKQHYDDLQASFLRHGIHVGFLSGSLKAAERKQTLQALAEGDIQILVGTHAVIQPEVTFRRLGLVITDEQHRFGVDQRIRLRQKGENPNVLVMTATPIPRTLAVVLYGDLDISIIDEMPPGRKPVLTRSIPGSKRDDCYRFVARQLQEGRQAYVVTPLIEDSETMDLRSAQEVAEELRQRFAGSAGRRGYRVALLHGAMKQAEKDQIMEAFYQGNIDLLVATVVIEVGINVPNATVMVIENAERFGLAQMHQLRGRVGRSSLQSWCFLIQGSESELSQARGKIMEESCDGFVIAEEDLRLRGPGDIFGTRQHGLPPLALADPVRHVKLLEHARDCARELLAEDPMLVQPSHQLLKQRVLRLFGGEIRMDL